VTLAAPDGEAQAALERAAGERKEAPVRSLRKGPKSVCREGGIFGPGGFGFTGRGREGRLIEKKATGGETPSVIRYESPPNETCWLRPGSEGGGKTGTPHFQRGSAFINGKWKKNCAIWARSWKPR